MMNDQEYLEFLNRWHRERPVYQAWGEWVSAKMLSLLEAQCGWDCRTMLRVPVASRVKEESSLLEKAFQRQKKYDRPYEEITDKVGVRFVVLKTDEVAQICTVIKGEAAWDHSQDRDFEEERARKPELFGYQSNHFIVRPREIFEYSGTIIPVDTTCEIQVRSLLQHAWAEMSHDTIYKPNVLEASPEAKRYCSQASALVEVVDEIFCRVAMSVAMASKPLEEASMTLSSLYSDIIKSAPADGQLNIFLLDAYFSEFDDGALSAIAEFFRSRPEIVERIKSRARDNILFRQPAILLVYFLARERGERSTRRLWPLTLDALHPIYSDLGLPPDNSLL
ncbi:MAG TPA: RelA/SpoT family protein [Syntrophaceae bacterium]|nr:RelA/SpoT family protein [Syntrophaceae bacterium]